MLVVYTVSHLASHDIDGILLAYFDTASAEDPLSASVEANLPTMSGRFALLERMKNR
jgi:hypothetical protein